MADLLPAGQRGPIGGAGPLDLTAYRVAIAASEYRRAVVVDAREWPDPWRGLEQTRDGWLEA